MSLEQKEMLIEFIRNADSIDFTLNAETIETAPSGMWKTFKQGDKTLSLTAVKKAKVIT